MAISPIPGRTTAPLPTRYTYDAVSLNGVAGTYVSTPDSVAASITGDIDIRVKCSAADWTTATTRMLVSKDFDFYIANTNVLAIEFIPTGGGAYRTAISSVAPTLTDGQTYWLRVTYNSTTGKVNFYQSDDGSTWTAVGSEQDISVGPIGIQDSAKTQVIGALYDGATFPFAGKIYQAQIYNGINGTLAVDFDASRYAGGTTLSGSTGETWTLQGNAVIHPTNNPMLGYLAEGARTNLCLQSNAFTTTWINSPALSTLSQNVIGPDGAVSAWTCADTDAVNTCRLIQFITLTAAAYTGSVFVKKTSSATTFPIIAFSTGTVYGFATLDTNNGVATAWVSNGYGTTLAGVSARCSSYNPDFWRFELTVTATAAAYTFYLHPAATANATQSSGTLDATVQGSAVFYGAQVELGSFASSYIPTTTIAVQRNADVLTYPSAGNIDGTKGWAYAEASLTFVSGGAAKALLTADTANKWYLYSQTAGTVYASIQDGVSGSDANSGGNLVANKFGSQWGSEVKLQASINGINGAASAAFTNMTPTSVIYVGRDSVGSFYAYCTIRNVRIGQRALSSSELQAITR